MADDKTHIRALIERWARAVHDGDMEGVLADHSDEEQGASFEIVSLDVTEGDDVAAHALLRCGTQEERELWVTNK